MSAQHELFGLYAPGRSPWHRAPTGAKLALVLVVSLVVVAAGSLIVSAMVGAAVVAALLVTRVPVRRAFWVPWSLLALLAVLFAAQVWWTSWREGALVATNVLACLYASRILTLTTPVPALLDALVALARPLRPLGIDPERVGLAAAITLRSIPYLLGSFDEVGQAARARGMERSMVARITPVVIDAVAYAQATGDALAARGLGEGVDD